MNRGRLFLLLVIACVTSTGPALRDEHAIHAAPAIEHPADEGGVLFRRLTDDVTLNPFRIVQLNDRYVATYLYTPLINISSTFRPVPGLATTWTISADGLTYRFWLNPKATFSDGTPVLASDVVFTLSEGLNPAARAVQLADAFALLDRVHTHAVDAHVVDVVFRERRARQLLEFNKLFVVPEHAYRQASRDALEEFAVGSGPYRLVRHERGKEVVLQRREDYWGEKPHIPRVVLKIIGSSATAWNAVTLGLIDETSVSSETWFHERTNAAVTANIEFRLFYTFNYNFVAWNTEHPLLQDKRVRRALAMCVPVDAIITHIYHGTARRLTGPFLPDTPAYNVAVPPIPYAPQEARRILTSLGWVDHDHDGVLDRAGRPLTFTLLIGAQNGFDREFAQLVQEELRKIGVAMTISAVDENTLGTTVKGGKFDAAMLGTATDAEPHLETWFGSGEIPPNGLNIARYRNPDVDRLIAEAQRELNDAKRYALYRRIHAILAEDQPFLWTVQVQEKWALRRRVHGAGASPGYGLFRWYPGELAWWIPRQDQHG
jgi:peptide/nickel transport system substrate-binding protein